MTAECKKFTVDNCWLCFTERQGFLVKSLSMAFHKDMDWLPHFYTLYLLLCWNLMTAECTISTVGSLDFPHWYRQRYKYVCTCVCVCGAYILTFIYIYTYVSSAEFIHCHCHHSVFLHWAYSPGPQRRRGGSVCLHSFKHISIGSYFQLLFYLPVSPASNNCLWRGCFCVVETGEPYSVSYKEKHLNNVGTPCIAVSAS